MAKSGEEENGLGKFIQEFKEINRKREKREADFANRRSTNSDIAKNLGDIIKEDFKEFKDEVAKLGNNIPGVKTVKKLSGALTKGYFDKKRLEKEDKFRANALGLSLEEVRYRRQEAALLEAQKEERDKQEELIKAMFVDEHEQQAELNIRMAELTKQQNKQFEQLRNERINATRTSKENESEAARRDQKNNDTLVGSLFEMTKSLRGLTDKFKKEGARTFLEGIGIAAGLLVAPFIAIAAFANQLSKELGMVKTIIGKLDAKFLGGRGAKMVQQFTDVLKALFEPLKKGFDFIAKSKVGEFIGKAVEKIRPMFEKIGKVFSSMSTMVKSTGSFGKIASFAAKFGKIAGKLFLPVTIVMTAWDTVKGFIDGFKEDGIIGGIKGAMVGLFDGLIGGLLDGIKGAVSWIANLLGFENFSAALDSFSFTDLFRKMIDGLFVAIDKSIEWIKTLFSDPTEALKQLWTGLMGDGGLYDILSMPINKAITWVRDMFGWGTDENGEKKEDFNLRKFIFGKIEQVWDYIKSIFSWEKIKEKLPGSVIWAMEKMGMIGEDNSKNIDRDREWIGEDKASKMSNEELLKTVKTLQADVNKNGWFETDSERKTDREYLMRLKREMKDRKFNGDLVDAEKENTELKSARRTRRDRQFLGSVDNSSIAQTSITTINQPIPDRTQAAFAW